MGFGLGVPSVGNEMPGSGFRVGSPLSIAGQPSGCSCGFLYPAIKFNCFRDLGFELCGIGALRSGHLDFGHWGFDI